MCYIVPQVKANLREPGLRFALYEPVEFIRHFLVDKLEFSKVSHMHSAGGWTSMHGVAPTLHGVAPTLHGT